MRRSYLCPMLRAPAVAFVPSPAPDRVTQKAQDLGFTLDPNEQSGLTGQTVTFLGLLDNSIGSTVVFMGLDVSLPGFDPTDITNVFSLDDLANGANRSGNMFQVYLGPGVATGSYFGTATLSYQYNGGANRGEITQNFRLNVVPEPAMIQLPAFLGLAGVVWWRRRRSA